MAVTDAVVTAADRHEIHVTRWEPSGGAPALATVQILHGLGEHVGRYRRFAARCCAHGFAVVGHDHRGHGPGRDAALAGHFADSGGWDKVVSDAIDVQRFALETWRDSPMVLFGHSMGSFLAQSVAARAPGRIQALVLSGSTFGARTRLRAGRLLARILIWQAGGRGTSPLLDRLGFASLNQRFAPNRTEFDWLSRDDAEVDRYVEDPHCGMPLTNRLWHDLLGGMLDAMSLDTLRRIPKRLPILITGGESDPLGGRRGQTLLQRAYERSGHSDVSLKLYPGGRHEMLNEINRDEFTEDVLAWIDRKRRI